MTGFKDGSVRWRQRALIEKIGEDVFFDAYLERGNVKYTLADLDERMPEEDRIIDGVVVKLSTAQRAFYDFLHELHTDSKTGRWERWQEVLELRGSIEFDEVGTLADSIDSTNVQRRREQIKAKQWRAERLNKRYSTQQQINVAVGTPNQWLEAIGSSLEPRVSAPQAPLALTGTQGSPEPEILVDPPLPEEEGAG